MATVPVATAAMGAVAGLPAGRLVASHFSVMSKSTAQIITAGPAVVERAMGEKKTKDELGGWKVHTKNGTVDNGADDEVACLEEIKRFLSFMPDNINQLAPLVESDDPVIAVRSCYLKSYPVIVALPSRCAKLLTPSSMRIAFSRWVEAMAARKLRGLRA